MTQANAVEIKALPALDIVGMERRTWYVLEWQNRHVVSWCEAFNTDADRAAYIKNLREGSYNMTIYELLTPSYFSIVEVERYIMNNPRIGEKV